MLESSIAMRDPSSLGDKDFLEAGFNAGLECHIQLNTDRKLFCHCSPNVRLHKPADYTFSRFFRPVLGEMGDYDEGMLIEFEKAYLVRYVAHDPPVSCLYEQDEQPPHWPDMNAYEIGIRLAYLFHMEALVDEIQVSRKQYLDGSITTGFQRTSIVGRDGWVPLNNGKKVRITNLLVEEDSARKVKVEDSERGRGRTVWYNLDRLGIPLTEVITNHEDIHTPAELREAAFRIGLVLRLNKLGKRGIGTARQDVNISFGHELSNRVELKGVQDLSMFQEYCARELVRQEVLVKIALELRERDVATAGRLQSELEHTYVDVSHLFEGKLPSSEHVAFAVRAPGFQGLLGIEIQPGKDFGHDIIEKAELISGIPREWMYHSDEKLEGAIRRRYPDDPENGLPFSTVDPKVQQLEQIFQGESEIAFFLVFGPKAQVIHALKKIIERLKYAFDGVPAETRRVLPNGNSEFLRVIHGKDRLYPDTDQPFIPLDTKRVAELKQQMGMRPWELATELKEQHEIETRVTEELILENWIDAILEARDQYPEVNLRSFSNFLLNQGKWLKRQGLDVSGIGMKELIFLHSVYVNYGASLLPEIAKRIVHDKDSIDALSSDLTNRLLSDRELEEVISEHIRQYAKTDDIANYVSQLTTGERNPEFKKLVAEVLEKVSNRATGKQISRKLRAMSPQNRGESK